MATSACRKCAGWASWASSPLAPGETFEYTSGCPLPTPVGTMRGTYHCVGENGIPFEVPIPEFVLAMPRTLH